MTNWGAFDLLMLHLQSSCGVGSMMGSSIQVLISNLNLDTNAYSP